MSSNSQSPLPHLQQPVSRNNGKKGLGVVSVLLTTCNLRRPSFLLIFMAYANANNMARLRTAITLSNCLRLQFENRHLQCWASHGGAAAYAAEAFTNPREHCKCPHHHRRTSHHHLAGKYTKIVAQC